MSDTDDPIEQTRMTIGQHLEELRWRLLKAIGYVMVALVVCLVVQQQLMQWATWPHRRVVDGLQKEVRFRDAPAQLRDSIESAKSQDETLEVRLAKLERRELKLREAVEPAGPRLQELVEAQAALDARIAALEDKLSGLGDQPSAADLAPITSERRAITADAQALHLRYEREVLPYVDRQAKVPDMRLMDIKYQGPFLSYLKLSFICALFLASPWVAKEMWGFIAVGLYPHEKKHINLFAPLSLLCFGLGGVFGYFVLIPVGLYFLATYAPPEMMAGTFALGDYLSLFMTLTVVVGLVFELPLIMSFLTLLGVMNTERFRKYRRYWWFAAVVIGALLTPPDPATQLLLAIPMAGLYEVGILISIFLKPTKPDPEPEPEPSPRIDPPGGAAPPTGGEEDSPEEDSTEEDSTEDGVDSDDDPDDASAQEETPAAPPAAEPDFQLRPVAQPRVARDGSLVPPPGAEAEEAEAVDPEEAASDSAGEGNEDEPDDEEEGDNDDPTLKYLYEDEEEGDNDDPTLKYLQEESEEDPAPAPEGTAEAEEAAAESPDASPATDEAGEAQDPDEPRDGA